MKIEQTYMGGNCPVQAEGFVNGKPFYFRARGQHWSMGIGEDPIGAPDWYRDQPWGSERFRAGWMPCHIAQAIIDGCLADYIAGKPGDAPMEVPADTEGA